MFWRDAWRSARVSRARPLGLLLMAASGMTVAAPVTPATASGSTAMATIQFRVVPRNAANEAAVLRPLQEALRGADAAPTNLEDVQRWSDRLTDALRQGGFPVGQVLMTESDWRAAATGGPVFTVYPGRVSAIVLKNKSRMADARLQPLLNHALCGTTALDGVCLLQTARLERATQLLQDLPGVAIASAPQFSPGTGVGDIQVVFDLATKGKPLQADVILDNKGIPSTGSTRLGVAASGNNYFGLGEDYALELLGTEKRMWTGSLQGGVPVGPSGLRLTGSVTRQQYTLNAVTPVAGVATTEQAGVRYPFRRGLDSNVWGGASLLHSQATTDFHAFGFATHATINSARFWVNADNGDRAQQLRTNLWSVQGALTMGHQSNDDLLDASGPQRAGDYAKLTGSAFGRYALNPRGDWFATGRITSQLTNRNLDASEKLTVGGPDAVRAYRADEGSFDDGVIFNTGLYHRFSVGTGHQLQLGGFVDLGVGRVNHKPWPYWEASYFGVPHVTNVRRLSGYGLSVDWLTPIGATFSVSAAKPFGFSGTSWVEPGGKKPVQYWLSLTWNP